MGATPLTYKGIFKRDLLGGLSHFPQKYFQLVAQPVDVSATNAEFFGEGGHGPGPLVDHRKAPIGLAQAIEQCEVLLLGDGLALIQRGLEPVDGDMPSAEPILQIGPDRLSVAELVNVIHCRTPFGVSQRATKVRQRYSAALAVGEINGRRVGR